MQGRVPVGAIGLDDVHAGIERHYTACIRAHGPTPRGVDWESLATQQMRMVQLLKVCDWSRPLTLNDLGCGYGALLALLDARHRSTPVDYLGVDLSAPMVAAARRRWKNRPATEFVVGSESPRVADYSVASGVFNVKLDLPMARWEHFVVHTLQHLHATSRHGFAVNFLSRLAPGAEVSPALYCTEPGRWIGFCQATLGARAECVTPYGMREFTLLVRPSSSRPQR